MQAPVPPENTTTYEIMSRLVKVIVNLVSLVILGLWALGAYSVYELWTAGDVRKNLELGWVAIGLWVIIRLIQFAIAWAILVPLEARIRGVNLRDPIVAAEIREADRFHLGLEAICLLFCVFVPLLIAHFRFNYFA